MKTIRLNTFETNSSSMHAIVIPERSNVKDYLRDITFKYNMDFSDRVLYVRDKPEEKASYLFQLIVKQINTYFVPVVKDDVEIPGAVSHNELVIEMFNLWMKNFKQCVKQYEHINVDFTGYKINREYTNWKNVTVRQYFIDEADGEYASTGCYGHAGVNGVLFARLFDRFDKAVKNEDLSGFKNIKEDSWDFTVYHIIEFIFDPKAVIIQYTDEYSDEGLAEMKQHIKKFIEMNDYRCNLIWPLGG